jgi:hypothetical protein
VSPCERPAINIMLSLGFSDSIAASAASIELILVVLCSFEVLHFVNGHHAGHYAIAGACAQLSLPAG